MFNTMDVTPSMIDEQLYFDEFDEEKYSLGKWFAFPVKGILSPSNN